MAATQDIAKEQKSRIYRVATLGVGIFIHLVVCWTVFSIGFMNIGLIGLAGLSALAIAGFLFLALLIGIEWNLNLEDPDMAVPQMIWALTVIIITSHFAVELKAVVLLSGLAMVVMGSNRLSRSQQVLVAGYGLFLYMVSIAYLSNIVGLGWVTEIVLIIAFSLVLVFGPALYHFERSMIDNALTDKNEELGKALEQIREMAVRDELTGVYNRRHLMEVLGHEKAMADRTSYTFSVCYVDLDYFKKVNDRFGHSTGDDVLRNFCRVAEDVVREVDCVARIGGEEFILLFAGTNQHDAIRGAERLAVGLADMHVTWVEPRYRITASVGIAEYHEGDTIQQTIDRADRALYDAKRTGRNKIVVAGFDQDSQSLAKGG